MNQGRLFIPSKTFLTGEYAVLVGGPSLVVNTKPQFQLNVTLCEKKGICRGLHKKSPAGLWIQKHSDLFQLMDIVFLDPHEGRGGFGASTAQFLAVYLLSQWITGDETSFKTTLKKLEATKGNRPQATKILDLKSLWNAYREVSWCGEGLPPSGADLMGQYLGDVSLFSSSPFLNENLSWPFPDHGFFIVTTGYKLATHKHLKTITEHHLLPLKALSEQVVQAFMKQNWLEFITSQEEFYGALGELNLTDPRSLHKMSEIQSDIVDFVKPCGALGAEVLMVFFERYKQDDVQSHLEGLDFSIIASEQDICKGACFGGEENDETTISSRNLFSPTEL